MNYKFLFYLKKNKKIETAMGVTVDKKSIDQDNYRKSIYEIGLMVYYRYLFKKKSNDYKILFLIIIYS